MKTLTYSIIIDRPTNVVFDTIINKDTYSDWAKAWGEGMTYDGAWEEGAHIAFFDTSGQGTKVLIEEVKPNESITMTHIAMVEAGGKEITEMDDVMKKWIGSKEAYYLSETPEDGTKLEVVITADEAFEEMMNAWTNALTYLKEVCERA